MTDMQIIQALIARDGRVTQQFLFRDCRPLFASIIRNVFSYEVDYDEFVNEFYLYLLENDAYRLRQFQGRSSVYQWLKVVAVRYFIAKRDRMIDMESGDTLSDSEARGVAVDREGWMTAEVDVGHLLSSMPNRRYAYVIRRLILEDAEPEKVAQELRTNVANLYNIKKRAVASMTRMALDEIEQDEKGTDK